MGMFDYIRVDPAMLPEKLPEGLLGGWQTKDTPEQYLATYEITKAGELHLLRWTGKEYAFEEALDDFHGDLTFYTSDDRTGEWFEFVARFTEGKLARIWRVRDDEEADARPLALAASN